ncbi:hypothetical protein SAMN05216522_102186 [Rosenbergiella nectarea]|uniref:Uncharacterized protein n=1 Tax=Rosenbergiella nectarea TaxID=988801 RepID=A0A1H9F6P5_9GAMM|nr:hypothetical protein SAMN05216522_102186 [Rosenbergiella nectarea]
MKGGKYHFGIDLEQALTLYAFWVKSDGKIAIKA